VKKLIPIGIIILTGFIVSFVKWLIIAIKKFVYLKNTNKKTFKNTPKINANCLFFILVSLKFFKIVLQI